MDHCHGEVEPIVAVPGFVEPVNSDLFEICPCVAFDGLPGVVAIGVGSPDTGGDYTLAFVS